MPLALEHAFSHDLPPVVADGVHALRYQVFRERLHWEIPAIGQMERDDYDDANPVVVLARSGTTVIGCCRLLPTTGRYMLKDTFPQLLGGRPAPVADDVWEISRFAVVKSRGRGIGFTTVPSLIIREIVRFALRHGIRQYVFVTTVGFERLLQRMGVSIERLAPPQQVGIEKSVALLMAIDPRTIAASAAIDAGAELPYREAA